MIIKIKNKKSGYYKLACIASIYHTKLTIPKTIQETLSFIPIQKPVNIKHFRYTSRIAYFGPVCNFNKIK